MNDKEKKPIRTIKTLPAIGKIIAVGSGKGGVGKSTTAACLSLALKDKGFKVGLLDADIYGPSVAKIFGLNEKPKLIDNKLTPASVDGLEVISMGMLIEEGQAAIWRGPMVTKALTQLFLGTNWGVHNNGTLDYLILDLPPGTGDIHLTIAQNFPIDGAIIVTTPQELSVIDVEKAIYMFRKVNIPIFGYILNMAYYNTDKGKDYVFGEFSHKEFGKKTGLKLLNEIALDPKISQVCDNLGLLGKKDLVIKPYIDIAEQILGN